VQRSVASQDDDWQVPAAAVIGLPDLTGCQLNCPTAVIDVATLVGEFLRDVDEQA